MAKGKLYIIPIPISENTLDQVLPNYNHEIVKELRFFVVEKIKTARQFLRKMDRTFPIDDSVFYELNKHDEYAFRREAIEALKKGNDVGILSEAGYPGVADPGSEFIALAHENAVKIVPLIGPSSILLALAGSGMNGQGFTFHGYLPKKDNDRTQKIKDLTTAVVKTGFAQLFIETPYRNSAMFQDLLNTCHENLKLTVAYDITGEKEQIKTKRIGEWKKHPFSFDKTPCVFVLGN
ncbi:SAM-dependent methyltransferase [Crocinitomix algicola]|uniref:SAM-dependent methyltransferase n=1 Tax=Crocinitomix algicola TaxID=1740263 RepID=UPI0008729944|nr:SAM-dependent methyltransferase [Crocinitomix algicola]